MAEPRTIRYIDLFCGLGAFHTSFDNANKRTLGAVKYECVYACDIDTGVRAIYEENYGLCPDGDITQLDASTLPDFEILCAGFPCQPFSIAGKKQAFDDKEKGNLFFDILRIVDAKQPPVLFLENVRNLQTVHEGRTFARIKHELESRGYIISTKIIDSKNCGSPQSRQRIFIIASKTGRTFSFPEHNMQPKSVSSIIDSSNTDWLKYKDKYDMVPTASKSGTMKYVLINRTTGLGGRQGERVYGINSYGATVCATSGGPGAKTGLYEVLPGKIRTLNIKETLQMFGFPIDYKYKSLANKSKNKMLFYLGNSIVVNVLDTLLPELEKMFV